MAKALLGETALVADDENGIHRCFESLSGLNWLPFCSHRALPRRDGTDLKYLGQSAMELAVRWLCPRCFNLDGWNSWDHASANADEAELY